jgi:hypothetical protein
MKILDERFESGGVSRRVTFLKHKTQTRPIRLECAEIAFRATDIASEDHASPLITKDGLA